MQSNFICPILLNVKVSIIWRFHREDAQLIYGFVVQRLFNIIQNHDVLCLLVIILNSIAERATMLKHRTREIILIVLKKNL